MSNFFTKPDPTTRRLKAFLYGPPGSGKTWFSLHAPSPAVIDMEKGTEFYVDKFDIMRFVSNDVDQVMAAVDELVKDPGGIKTLVLDSFTAFCDALTDKHRRRMRVKKGNPNYELQPLDQNTIKNDIKSFVQKLIALDMNVIATAATKNLYASGDGDFMKLIGTQPDVNRAIPYMFDVVLDIKYNPSISNERIAIPMKDRTQKLPPEGFPFSWETVSGYIGSEDLQREAVKFNTDRAMLPTVARNTTIVYGGDTIKTAGVTAEQLTTLTALAETLGEDVVTEKLFDLYQLKSLLDLRRDEASLFINTMSEPQTESTQSNQ